MKFLSILALATLCLLGPVACTSTGGLNSTAATYVTPPNVQIAAQALTTDALTFVSDPKPRAVDAADCEQVAHAVRTLSTGTAPTVAEMQTTIKQFGGPTVSPGYALLAGNLGALYASFYPALTKSGKAATVTAYLEALASGVEAGAAPYLSPATASVDSSSVDAGNRWELTPEGRRLLGTDAGRVFNG